MHSESAFGRDQSKEEFNFYEGDEGDEGDESYEGDEGDKGDEGEEGDSSTTRAPAGTAKESPQIVPQNHHFSCVHEQNADFAFRDISGGGRCRAGS